MCFSICNRVDKLVGDPLHRSTWCSNKAKIKQWRDCRLWKQWFLKHVSGPGDVLPLGCFTTCKKNQAHQRNMSYKKIHIMFPNSTDTSPSDNSRHSKGILCLISITLRDSQKNYSSLLKSFSRKTFSKMSCYKTMTNWCTSNNSQKLFSEMDKI